MSFAGISTWAVLAAAVAGWLAGALWYMALSEPWARAQGRTTEEIKGIVAARQGTPAAYFPYALTFMAELVMAWALAGVLGHLGPGEVTLRNGLISAFFLWLGFVLPTSFVNNMFGMRRPALTAIDSGHWLLVLLIMGGVIGAVGA